MTKTTTIRISRHTHEELHALARAGNQSVAETVARAVRLLRQEDIGKTLSVPLDDEEIEWLDAEAG